MSSTMCMVCWSIENVIDCTCAVVKVNRNVTGIHPVQSSILFPLHLSKCKILGKKLKELDVSPHHRVCSCTTLPQIHCQCMDSLKFYRLYRPSVTVVLSDMWFQKFVQVWQTWIQGSFIQDLRLAGPKTESKTQYIKGRKNPKKMPMVIKS